MSNLKITQCKGEGQGECRRCRELKGWNRHWTSFLYEIEGREGVYCGNCVKAIEEEADNEK